MPWRLPAVLAGDASFWPHPQQGTWESIVSTSVSIFYTNETWEVYLYRIGVLGYTSKNYDFKNGRQNASIEGIQVESIKTSALTWLDRCNIISS